MEIVLDKSWTKALKLFKNIGVEELTIEKQGDKISIEEMDPSHVAMVSVEFTEKDEKEEIEEKDEEEIERVGIEVDRFYKALKSYQGYDIKMTVEDDQITLERVSSTGANNYDISLSALEPQTEEIPEPELEFKAKAKANILTPINKMKKIFGSGLNPRFETKGDKLFLTYGKEDTLDGFRAELGSFEELNGGGEVRSTYTEKLLSALKKKWTLYLANDLPLKAEKEFSTYSGGWKANAEVLIAPRVVDDGEYEPTDHEQQEDGSDIEEDSDDSDTEEV